VAMGSTSMLLQAGLASALLLFSAYGPYVKVNAVLQVVWFAVSACVPAVVTGFQHFRHV